jgi:thiol-disulfide isomerase/thioredoxin
VIVAQGARESLEKLGQAFGETGVQALVQSIAELQAEAAAKVSDYIGSDVQELSLDSLSEWLQEDEGVLIIFYGHACSHCKAMAPALQEAATQLRQSGVRVGAINLQATPAAEEIAQALHLRGLPTVRYVMNGNHLEYGGDRSAASLVAFATKAKGMAPDAGAQQIADAAREAAGEAEAAAGGATETGSEAAVGGATETGAAVEAASAAEEEDGSLEAPDAEGAAAAIDVEGATAAAADSLAAESKVEASPAAAVEKAALPHEAAGAAATGAEAPGAAAAGAEAPESKVHKSKLAKSNKAPAAAAA